MFQEKFHKIQEQGFWEHKSYEGDSGRPSIYTMESVRKLGQEPLRLTSYLSIDPEGFPVERADFEALEDSSVVQELVTDAIASARKPVNFKQVAQAMVTRGSKTRMLFNEHSVDIAKLLAAQQSGKINDGEWIPFLGPLYSKANWELISEYLEIQLAEIKKAKTEPSDLLWIAPSDGFWGKAYVRQRVSVNWLIDQPPKARSQPNSATRNSICPYKMQQTAELSVAGNRSFPVSKRKFMGSLKDFWMEMLKH